MAQMKEFFNEIKVGAKQNHKNMTLYCLLSADEARVDFLTLDNALGIGALSVTEVTEGGSVPELKVNNKSDHKILLLDGEELVGAKQKQGLKHDYPDCAQVGNEHSGIVRRAGTMVLSKQTFWKSV